MEKSKRFALFVRELMEAAPVATFEEARLLLETRLNEVEDRYSVVPYNPSSWRDDGRLYPPQDDMEKTSGLPSVRMFKALKHRVYYGANGSIRIESVTGEVVLDKPGKDGGLCPR
jgi:hypothetical protein